MSNQDSISSNHPIVGLNPEMDSPGAEEMLPYGIESTDETTFNTETVVDTTTHVPLPTDWWRSTRTAVSGSYQGEFNSRVSGKYALDLRIDVDARPANSTVLNRISGDIFQLYRMRWPLGPNRIFNWRIYRESWIVDNPKTTMTRNNIEITGRVRHWKIGQHPNTKIRIIIPRIPSRTSAIARVFINNFRGTNASIDCTKKSNTFRQVRLEVDVCESVNKTPIVPDYDTHAHPDRPGDLPRRRLTIEQAYRESGIDLSINPTRSIVDDSLQVSWTAAELHDAMEQYYSVYQGSWPKWNMWCLLGGIYEHSGVGGIMFDAAASVGGAGVLPERQGCAVFRQHRWFNNLPTGEPTNDQEAQALRQYLYTYVHEIGHGFNFLHSWNKSRHDSLSWMNYDWRYDARNGDGSFWNNFRFEFDVEELMHIRHGDRASVIMGGDPWSSGGHMETPADAMSGQIGLAPIELLLRSPTYFQFMQPVDIEFRLRNTTTLPMEMDTELNPEYGNTKVFIRRPDGRIVEYHPVLNKLALPSLQALQASDQSESGNDRHSQNVSLSYGSLGHCFDEPGEYLIRAAYQGPGDILIYSNTHRIRVGLPFSRQEEQSAQDYFSYDTGMALYFNGSSSQFLVKAMDTLQEMAERYKETPLGAHLSLILAKNLSQPFYKIKKGKRCIARDASPQEVINLTEQAMKCHKNEPTTFSNISYHDLCNTHAEVMIDMVLHRSW